MREKRERRYINKCAKITVERERDEEKERESVESRSKYTRGLTNDLGEFDAFSFPFYFEPCPTPSQPFNQLYR